MNLRGTVIGPGIFAPGPIFLIFGTIGPRMDPDNRVDFGRHRPDVGPTATVFVFFWTIARGKTFLFLGRSPPNSLRTKAA